MIAAEALRSPLRNWYSRALMRRIVLFDIDGTLLSDRGASRGAFAEALRDVYGVRRRPLALRLFGRTDPQIAHMVLRDAGHEADAIDNGDRALVGLYLPA